MRILIADDDPVSLKILERLVERAGHSVASCADGNAAWEKLAAEELDLAILDWEMPGCDGPELCRRIRRMPRDRQPHVVLLTARTAGEDLIAGMAAGADEYLKKPIEAAELTARLKAWARGFEKTVNVARSEDTSFWDRVRPAAQLEGQTIDSKYRVIEKIGEGGMGVVYRARHLLLGEPVALKVIHEDRARDEGTCERFLREARALLHFVHPNAIPVRDCGLSPEGVLYMTLDLSTGRSLRSVMFEEGKLAPPRALALVRQCLLALGEAHAHGIAHRDFKPENVLVERIGTPAELARVCDFGLAKALGNSLELGTTDLSQNALLGTPHYMSPEQARGEAVDHRSDLYSVGCVLYELLSGEKVFKAEMTICVLMDQMREPPESLRERVTGIAPELDALVMKLLAKAPEDRFQSAAEVVAAIDALLPQKPRRPLKVLLAEDNPVAQVLTRRMLEKWGHAVRPARSGDEAVTLAAAETFDVVLMDGDMPGTDGFEATARIREEERRSGGHLPIVALTAFDGVDDRRRCLAVGMDDYVAKPVDAARLFRAIEAASARSAGQAAARPDRAFDGTLALARMGGDAELLREIAGQFVEQAPALAKRIGAAIARSDREGVASAAHELKGAASSCSANVVSSLADGIEGSARAGDLAGAATTLAKLQGELSASLDLLGALAGAEES